jgi:hypothetical protein
MARQIIPIDRFSGLSDGDKEGLQSSFLWARSVDYRSDPRKLMLLPKTMKASGTVVTDLIVAGDRQDTDNYFYGDTGNIYKVTASDVWTNEHTVGNSQGNGMKYYGEDRYLYYTNDIAIGRYGPFGGTKAFADNFMGAEGGIPQNTHSLNLTATSSMYATAADSASLSLTSDLTLEIEAKLKTLPAVGGSMVLMSKWKEQGNKRSYSFEIYGVSAYFGAGVAALTISSNTTDAPVDSAATGTVATYVLSATNVSFAPGQKILIHQSQGANAGRWERNEISSYTAGTINLANALQNTYATGAQVLVLKEYTDITIQAGKTLTAKAWNGTVGGILAYLASGTVTVEGNISANGCGFSGGAGGTSGDRRGTAGTSPLGVGSKGRNNNAQGGGGGNIPGTQGDHGGGGANGTVGGQGSGSEGGLGGIVGGSADLTTLIFGGGGGGGARWTTNGGAGGNCGGIVILTATQLTVSGGITSNGADGTSVGSTAEGGGGGSGGSILLKTQVGTLGTGLITADGGGGGSGFAGDGGNGGSGRIHLDYYTSYTGTTTPTLDYAQDNNLVTTTSYQLRLCLSSNGTNEEFLTKTLTSLAVDGWNRFQVTWDASASLAVFFENGVSLGQATGALTAIYDSDALFAIGARFDGSGNPAHFLDARVDDVRVFGDIRTDNELYNSNETELIGSEDNFKAYWQLDNAATDSTSNANTLTLVNTPTYDATDVPFSAATTRQDLDQELNTSGNTYAVPTAISETATNRQTFVPDKDPQKSVEINVSDKGSGAWVLTVHDGLNRIIATATIAAASMHTGDIEFVFTNIWRPVRGASYHFHLASTGGTPKVVSTTADDLETADFHTYFQFLVEDQFHPIWQQEGLLAIGNERYLATWDAVSYNPHALVFPSGYRVTALGTWREYLAIGVTQGSSLTDNDQGKIFFWDGHNSTYNFYIDIPEGGVNAILSGDPMYYVAGYAGFLMRYDAYGPVKLLRFPKMTNNKTIQVLPGAMAMWRSLVHVGIAGDSDSSEIERGVYSFGTLNRRLPETFSFDYPTSLGITQSTDLKIGLVMAAGSSLFISWQNGSSFGVDKVSPTNPPFATGTCEFLITDASKIWQPKTSNYMRGYFKALVTGDSMTLKYKIDRQSNWVYGDAVTDEGKIESRIPFPMKANRFNEFQAALDIATSNLVSPEFYGLGIDIDNLDRERRT